MKNKINLKDLFFITIFSFILTMFTCNYLIDYIYTVGLFLVFYIGYFLTYFLAIYSTYYTLYNFIERKRHEKQSCNKD